MASHKDVEAVTVHCEQTTEPHAPAPSGPLYYRIKIGPIRLPYFASPIVQLLYVAVVFFLCPGLYNALSGLGGGGQLDATVANNATVALYSTFATTAFFSGSICNKLGVRITLTLGCLGYSLYIASFLCYNHTRSDAFVIVAGALLGMSAAVIWAPQTVIMMSYPKESQKGRYIAIFWAIFNVGAVIGSLIPLLQTVHSEKSGAVGDGTYSAFLALTALGAIMALFICNASKVVRTDGSTITLMQHPTWKSELLGLYQTLRTDWYITASFPMFFASNWFYTYQFNDVNLARFDIRTRSLNSLLYWCSQIFGALAWGALLDTPRLKRKTRARVGLIALFTITMGLWGGGYAFQTTYTRQSAPHQQLDWISDGYAGPVILYICYGLFDAIWQTYIYWTLGAISNDSRKLAILAGFYKSLQSAGAAIVYRIDALKIPYMNIFASTWGLLAFGLVCAAPVVWTKIENHTESDDESQEKGGVASDKTTS